jgi:hypothetical protein
MVLLHGVHRCRSSTLRLVERFNLTRWCSGIGRLPLRIDEALEFILATLNGENDNNEWSRPVTAVIQTVEEHGRCGHCA